MAVPESYLAPQWREWAVQPPSTTRHGVDNTARALDALENTVPSLKQDGMTRTEKNRHFHRIIEKFLQQWEEDRERPAPVALKVREKKGSKKYVNITKEDTDNLLQTFLNIEAQQQQQQQQQALPQDYLQTPTTSKIKKQNKTKKSPQEIIMRHKAKKIKEKATEELHLLQQQTGLGYGGSATHNNKAIRPVHFTSLFTGRQTVLI